MAPSSIVFPSGAKVEGYATANPDLPYADVDRIDEHFVERRPKSLTENRHIVKDQASKLFKRELVAVKAKMPEGQAKSE
eukprot:5236738-Pyramimonas_sp.AAC.1